LTPAVEGVEALAEGAVYRSEGYGMFIDHVSDAAGDPTVELWRFCGEDEEEQGCGHLEIRVHEIVSTERSGKLAVYYRQWISPDGEPAWGNRPQRKIASIGSLKALIGRRKMRAFPATPPSSVEVG
jgi:hypothetical protein